METLKNWFKLNSDQIQKDYFEFLKFQSIGTDPEKMGECEKCAEWLGQFLKKMDFVVTIEQKSPQIPPIIVAERISNNASKSILFYGHYDVQPVDPVELWESLPFEPTIRNNRVYARGAQDDKGQLFACLQGIRALIENKIDLPTIKIVFEGQEECGSATLSEVAESWKKRLTADILLVCDTDKDSTGRPRIVAGLRGILTFTLTLNGPKYDLHSGSHGGIAPNPVQGMAQLIASLHTSTGAIAVEEFCDSIIFPSEEELKLANENIFDKKKYQSEVGVLPLGGEQNIPVISRLSFMPTIEINGLHAGYGGVGAKTVIPTHAIAKISCRLVPGQDPVKIKECLKKHFEKHCPRGMTFQISEMSKGSPGFRLSINSPTMTLARNVLNKMDVRGAVIAWDGASIPIVSKLKEISGAEPLMVGFGMQEDHIHSPNESYSIEQFDQAMLWGSLIFLEFGKAK